MIIDNNTRGIIAETQDLISRLISGELDDAEIADLRADAVDLLDAMSSQMQEHTKTHGPAVANPINRAWYLLNECMQHRTLLDEDAK